ncbi:MAG: ABC transporter ATP-binding protein [Candidatus Eremiobacteraeota bacterium]|nr:ABC transporter ATP-binding protein [Candidatus Eremiobacteraeota bacterium]MBC5826817.1 ABC transporter ATP-binding protein [Candidatus Eremiobacteraeota bacterium]
MAVSRGEVFGFLGPNGAGKTTAVKLLLGLASASSGSGWVLGEDLGARAARRRIGYLPELFRYQDWLSAREVLALHCALSDMPTARRAAEVEHALDTVGLARRADDRVGTFSKGMQQRLGLGVALLGTPELVFLDEPTSALDPVGRHDVREIIGALKRRGATVFLNSHLLTEVEHVCDRVAMIDRGRIVRIGSVTSLIGVATELRVRVADTSPQVDASLRRYGRVSFHDGWYVIHGIAQDRVPALVADIVAVGARVHAVEPHHATLEERFLQILRGPSNGAADDRSAGGP